jgi:ribosome-binding protein aMBF1 (putative translation factor)
MALMIRSTHEPATYESFLEELWQMEPELRERDIESRPSIDVALVVAGIRVRECLTQWQLAERMGVSQAYVARLESGLANPSIRRLNTLLQKAGYRLHCTVEPLDGEPHPADRVIELAAPEAETIGD